VSETHWLDLYLARIDACPTLDDSWFPEALARMRAQDASARREICASLLRIAFALSNREFLLDHGANGSAGLLLDYIQEANVGIAEGLETFAGDTTAELLQHVETHVTRALRRAFPDVDNER
jgi:hypothetical protein